MATTELPTYRVHIAHPAGIPMRLIAHLDEDPNLLEAIKEMSMEHARICVQQLHELNHSTSNFEVGVVSEAAKKGESDAELSVMFVTGVHLADDNAAMCLLEDLTASSCEDTSVYVHPSDDAGLSNLDIDPSVFDTPDDGNDTDDKEEG